MDAIAAQHAQNAADAKLAEEAACAEYPYKGVEYELKRDGYVVGYRAGKDDERRKAAETLDQLRAEIAVMKDDIEAAQVERDNARGLLREVQKLATGAAQ